MAGADLKTTAEELAAPHWCPDCGAWQPGKVCPVAGVLHREAETYTASAFTHLRYCIAEGDNRVCHVQTTRTLRLLLRAALDELDCLLPERDTLLAENAKLRAALAPFAAFAATLPPVGDEPRFTDSGALASGAVFADPAKPPLRFITYADVRRALTALEAP